MIFALYNIQVKKSTPIQAKVMTAGNISVLQTMIFLLVISALSYLVNFKLSPLKLFLFALAFLLFIANYYRYVKSDYLDNIQTQFEEAEINTTKNRRISVFIALLLLFIPVVLVIFMSYFNTYH